MDSTLTYNQALSTLQTTGAVTLPGAPAAWSRVMRVLFIVLRVLVAVVAVGGLVFSVIAIAMGTQITIATVFGVISVLAMLVGVMVVLTLASRRHQSRGERQRTDVWIGSQGLMLRGVGPIPWQDFGPAGRDMVPSEHSNGWVSRAVMPLTRSGVFNVNHRLAPQLRERVCPATGPMWNKQHLWIYVPGVEGLRQHEVMGLINQAHWMFSRQTT